MTQQERAGIAFKVLGVVFLVEVARTLPIVWEMLRSGFSDHVQMAAFGGNVALLALAGFVALAALAGVCCLRWAPRLARRLLPALQPEPPWPFEFVRGGVCLTGVWLLLLAIAGCLALATPGGLGTLPATAIFLCLAVTFLATPGRIATTLARWARGGLSSTAEAGAVLMLLYVACMGLGRAVGALGFWQHVAERPEIAAWQRQQMLLITADGAARFVLAVVMAIFAATLCSRFGRPRKTPVQCGAMAPFSSSSLMAAALAVSVCYLLVAGIGLSGRLWRYHWLEWSSVWEIAWAALVSAVLIMGVLWVTSFITWPFGRRLSGSRTQPQEVETSSALLAVEVALAMLAISGFRQAVGEGLSDLARTRSLQVQDSPVRSLLAVLVILTGYAVLLAFKGDLAWLCRPRRMSAQEPLPSVRAAVLQTWLFLAGLWFAVKGGAALAAWVAAALISGMWDATWSGSAWEVALGVALIVGAQWLSVRLSYGPLSPAIRRRLNHGRG